MTSRELNSTLLSEQPEQLPSDLSIQAPVHRKGKEVNKNQKKKKKTPWHSKPQQFQPNRDVRSAEPRTIFLPTLPDPWADND